MVPTMFQPEKLTTVLKVTVHFIWLSVAIILGLSQRVRKEVSE